MEKYYEVLEVSETASKEVIEKAYKVLAKKYHPDLQPASQKKDAEEKIKKINFAYEILSDEIKRKEYDGKLEAEKQKELNQKMKEYSNSFKNNKKTGVQEQFQNANITPENASTYEEIYTQAYEDLYNKITDREYVEKVTREYVFKQKLKRIGILLIVVVIIALTGFVLWKIPSTNEYLRKLYEENAIVKIFADIVLGIVKGFKK